MIQAIIFDMGGVLLQDRWGGQRLREFDALLGWQPGDLHQRLYSGPAWQAVSTGQMSLEDYWGEVGQPLEKDLPPDFPAFVNNFNGEELDEALVALAWRLRSRYRIALLSNATPQLTDILACEPRLQGLFDVTMISALEGMRKPDPDIYLLTCQRLELPPSACVFIDDKERNTLVAESLGMKTIVHENALATKQKLRELGI